MLPVGYCTNVHPGRNLDELRRSLLGPVARVARRVGTGPLPVGVWLSAEATHACAATAASSRLLLLLLFCLRPHACTHPLAHARVSLAVVIDLDPCRGQLKRVELELGLHLRAAARISAPNAQADARARQHEDVVVNLDRCFGAAIADRQDGYSLCSLYHLGGYTLPARAAAHPSASSRGGRGALAPLGSPRE